MLKITQLEIFAAAVESGSVSRTAEILHTSQPYISRVLKSLEEEIGKALFERTPHGIVPTRDGKFLYSYAKSILADLGRIEEMKHAGIERLDTRLSVSVYSLFLRDEIYVEFAADSLSDTVSLSVREGTLEQLFDNVLSGASEIGLASINEIEFPAVRNEAILRQLHLQILDESPLYVHLGHHHPAHGKDAVNIRDLIYSTYVHIPFDRYSRARMEVVIDGHPLRELKQTMAVDNYHLLPYMVKETDSFMFGNQWQLDEMNRLGLENCRMENSEIRMYLTLIQRRESLSAESQKLLELLKRKYGITD